MSLSLSQTGVNRGLAAFGFIGAGLIAVFAVIAWSHAPGEYTFTLPARRGPLELATVSAVPAALALTFGAVTTGVWAWLFLGMPRLARILVWWLPVAYLVWAGALAWLVADAGMLSYAIILFIAFALFPAFFAYVTVVVRRNSESGITPPAVPGEPPAQRRS